MLMRQCGTLGAVTSAVVLLLQLATDQALAQDRRQECSARYKTAKTDGTLGSTTWPQFFSRCMADLKSEAETPAETKPAAATAEPVNPLKPTSPEPAHPAAIETEPPATSAAEAPAPVKPASPPPAAATAAPTTPETVNPLQPGSAPTPTSPSKVAPVAPAAATATPPAPPSAVSSAKEAAPAPREPVFPTAIAPAYAKEKPHIARQKTCLDQYNANKATDSNGGLKWLQKGGGYLGACNKRLKGQS